jgi:hypothetical protein
MKQISDVFLMNNNINLPSRECHIEGLEDVRLFYRNGQINYFATSLNYMPDDRFGIVNGIYNYEKLTFENNVPILSPTNAHCEKNWIGHNDFVIYKWHPLEIGQLNGNRLEIKNKYPTQVFFKHLRGSSNIVEYNNQLYVIAHGVKYGAPRKYYHLLIVFEKDTFKVIKYTVPFYFDKFAIEYCLGLHIHNDILYASASRNDCNPIICQVELKEIEKMYV